MTSTEDTAVVTANEQNMNASLSHVDDECWDDNWVDLTEELNSTPFAMDEKIAQNFMDMSLYEDRLATFRNWPEDHPQKPNNFAKYGMFYTGT